jgi:(p)ppGpp synthase/HD superfamily hydrolase
VVVHHRLCKDALKYISDGEEMIYCNWEKTLYQYQITVALKNTKGALAELLSKLAFMGINIADIPCGEINSQKAEYFRFNIESEELDSKVLFEKLSKKVKLIDIVSLTDAYNK